MNKIESNLDVINKIVDLQRIVSNKTRYSNNSEKMHWRVSKVHNKIKYKRLDGLYK